MPRTGGTLCSLDSVPVFCPGPVPASLDPRFPTVPEGWAWKCLNLAVPPGVGGGGGKVRQAHRPPFRRARCAQEICPQHLYHGPALRWMCTRPMALSLTGPPCSLTTAKCSVAPKSAEPQNHAYPGKQGLGCKARRGGHLGMPRSPSTPQPAGLEFRIPPRVPLNAGLSRRTWRHPWRPNQGREISGPLQLLLSPSAWSSWLYPGTEVQPVLGLSPGLSQWVGRRKGKVRVWVRGLA